MYVGIEYLGFSRNISLLNWAHTLCSNVRTLRFPAILNKILEISAIFNKILEISAILNKIFKISAILNNILEISTFQLVNCLKG